MVSTSRLLGHNIHQADLGADAHDSDAHIKPYQSDSRGRTVTVQMTIPQRSLTTGEGPPVQRKSAKARGRKLALEKARDAAMQTELRYKATSSFFGPTGSRLGVEQWRGRMALHLPNDGEYETYDKAELDILDD